MKLSTYVKFFLGNLSSQFTNKDDAKPLGQLLEDAKEFYGAIVPHRPDADTQIDTIQLKQSTLVFNNTLFTVKSEELDPDEFKKILKYSLKTEARRIKRLRRILEKGGTLRYKYVDINGKHVAEVDIKEHRVEEELEYLKTLRIPAIALSATENKGLSQIGGLPALPDDIHWPEWQGKPLSFLCQINIDEIPSNCENGGLPSTGMIYFFYDQEQQTWGFDHKDEGSWRVIYTTSPPSNNTIRPAPNGLKKDFIYRQKPVKFSPIMTYPDLQDDRIDAFDFDDLQGDKYIDLCSDVFQTDTAHHLFGYPSPVQGNEMDLECQLVSHGLYCGDATGYQDPRAKELGSGRHDWILLLQLDTDNDTGMMWGDSGMLYFWIKKQDLRQGRFDKCWMILQCS